MVFSPPPPAPPGGKPRRAGRRCLLAAGARGRCLCRRQTWSGRPDPGRRGRAARGHAGASPRARQPVPAFLPPPFHPGFLPSFLPSFQAVELLSRQVRSLAIAGPEVAAENERRPERGAPGGDVGSGTLPPGHRAPWAGVRAGGPALPSCPGSGGRGEGECGCAWGSFVPNPRGCVADTPSSTLPPQILSAPRSGVRTPKLLLE